MPTIEKYAEDGSKQPRDEFFFSFCIPSTCSHEDLQKSLRQIVTAFGDNIPFNLQVNVDERNCQVEREISFTRADTIYMTVMGTIISFGIFCTLYHLFTRLEGLQQFKFSENVHRVVKEFSFSHTIKKLASESKNEDGLESLNGMKVVSMFLIIMGHRMMFYISSPLANPVYVEDTYRHVGWMVLLNGPVLVDSFFTISGFLASYMMLSIIHKRRRMVNLGTVFLHRLLRLTPAYAVVLGFYCTIFIQLGDGPFWDERVGVEQERCLESWWTNILYINNYVKADKICMFQSWYLTCDTHYFLFAPALVYLLWKSPKLGLLSMGFLIGISIILPCVIIFINQEEPFLLLYMRFLRDPIVNSTFKNIYIPSHMRACAYLIGILTGYMKFHMRLSNAKINSKINYLGWIVSLSSSVMVFCVSYIFYVPTEDKDYLFAGVFGSLHHVIWSLFSAWVILSVSEGYGAWIAPLFNWRPLVLLGRITYPAFLCHGAIQLYSAATTRAPVHTGLFVVFNFAASDIVWAYIAGFILSLVIEAPIRAIEKLIMGNHEKISEERPIKNLEFGDKKLGVDSFSIRIPKVTKLHK
ncbi:hypothetical protein HHI36_011331 [Cryptolaemus montrouzieri]|uniref:Acyltransferase 3 domain-containing protein n=1 Tax=Cryptolaemus montrouzieri TaxID=559131 RepID=A0ABD2MLF8_9CUCU